MPEGTAKVDFVTPILQSYFGTYKKRVTLYISTLNRVCQKGVYHSQIFDWKRFASHKCLWVSKTQYTNKQVSLSKRVNQRLAYYLEKTGQLQKFAGN